MGPRRQRQGDGSPPFVSRRLAAQLSGEIALGRNGSLQTPWPVLHIGIFIARPPRDVYEFARQPGNLRVLPNAAGSEVVFSLFRRPEMSDAEFRADAEQVREDLATLKRLLEGERRS